MSTLKKRTSSLVTQTSRAWVRVRKRDQTLRHVLPATLIRRAASTRSLSTELRRVYLSTAHRCAYDNIYHCCVQKTGSQWLMSLLSDPLVYRYTALSHYHPGRQGEVLRYREDSNVDPAPKPIKPGRIVSPLRVSPAQFRAVPKSGNYRLFFVVRDPRDLLVSWYFSTLRSHIVINDPSRPLVQAREALASMPVEEGLHYAIDYWKEHGRFRMLMDWPRLIADDERACLVRYEDLVGEDKFDEFRRLFRWLDVPIPDAELSRLLDDFSFTKLSGRSQGDEDQRSHLRKATPGDWRGYFTKELLSHLEDCVGDLPGELGYET